MSMDFIEQFEGALSREACAALVARFEVSDAKVRGATGSGVNTTLKNSWDITISNYPAWKDAEETLNNAMLRGLVLYLRKYPYAALAPFLTHVRDEARGVLLPMQPETLSTMPDKELAGVISQLFRPGSINIQKYIAGEGGYPHWHSEIYPVVGDSEPLHRVLLWTIYLNDDFEDGETEFFHQRMVVKPRTGSVLIAPAGFTHTHRGNRPKGGDKYIATSWVLLQKAETLYSKA